MPSFSVATQNPLNPQPAIVRAAAHNEHAAIADLMLRANREYRTQLPVRIYEAYMKDLRALVGSWADKDFLVAEADGRLLGAVVFYRDASLQGLNLPREWASMG